MNTLFRITTFSFFRRNKKKVINLLLLLAMIVLIPAIVSLVGKKQTITQNALAVACTTPGPDPACDSLGADACKKTCPSGSVCATSHMYCTSSLICECPPVYDVDTCATCTSSPTSVPTLSGACTCPYPETCSLPSDPPGVKSGVHTCNGIGTPCGYDASGACQPNCSACISPKLPFNDLSSFPRPQGDTGIGIHWSADTGNGYDVGTANNAVCLLKRIGASWIKIVADAGNAVGFAQVMKQNNIEPIVRLYRGQPNPGTLRPQDLDAVSQYVGAGVSYFEPNNEPNLQVEWSGGIPSCDQVVSQVMQGWAQDAVAIQQRGGYPVFPAFAPGSNCGGNTDDDQLLRNSFDWLNNNTCQLADGTSGSCLFIFDAAASNGRPAVMSVHNYNLNHDNSGSGGSINFYTQDSDAFLKFTFYDSIIRGYLGRSIPILSTEGGMIIGNSDDSRFPTTDANWHRDVTVAMANYQMNNSTPYFFTTAFWLSTPNPGVNPWGEAPWYNLDLSPRLTQTIDALTALPKKTRDGSSYSTSCSAGTSTRTTSLVYGIGPVNRYWFDTPKTPEWEVQGIQKIAEACSTITQIGFNWTDIEPNPPISGVHTYIWDDYDRMINAAIANGLKIVSGIVQSPPWANGGHDIVKDINGQILDGPWLWPATDSHRQDYIDFVKAVVSRYKGKLIGYEFWNEANGCGWHPAGCGGDTVTKADEYSPWLKVTYEAAKAVDPSVLISTTGIDIGGTKTDMAFINRLYDRASSGQDACNGKPCWDATAIHPYGAPMNYAGIDALRQTMVNHGDSNKPIWVTEYGWNTDETTKSNYLQQVLSKLTQPPYSSFVTIARYLIIADVQTAQGYGLTDENFNPKQSYNTFRSAACFGTTPSGTPIGTSGGGTLACVKKGNFCFTDQNCRDGSKSCDNFVCGDKILFGFGFGYCIPKYQPSACYPDALDMKVSENPVTATPGKTLTFFLNGSQGNLLYKDDWTPSGIVDCSGGFWGSKTCNVLGPGFLTWTHYWKTCSDDSCRYASTFFCSKAVTIDVAPPPTPTPLPPPCGGDPNTAVCQTQIGPITISTPQGFIKTVMVIVLGIAGVFSVILIIYSGYIFMTSGGNEQKIAEARQRLTAALIGLLFIVFSLLLFEVIGVDILRIPGLGG